MDEFVTSLLIAAGQTLVGMLGGFATTKIKEKYYKENSFAGPFDLWKRGIMTNRIGVDEALYFDGLISPYIQLFPRNPYENGKRWNTLYSFEGKINSKEYSKLEFYAGSDDTIRTGSLNGETLVGLYARYGYIGEGFLGVIPTKMLLKVFPDFFSLNYFGARAIVKGVLKKCPTQHYFIAKKMFDAMNVPLAQEEYKDVMYLEITKIIPFTKRRDITCSLLGSPWAATDIEKEPFIVQYGYISNPEEMNLCYDNMRASKSWDNIQVFYDALRSPSQEVSFTNKFIL